MVTKTPTGLMDALSHMIEIADGIKDEGERRKLLAMVVANYGCTLSLADKSSLGGFRRRPSAAPKSKPNYR